MKTIIITLFLITTHCFAQYKVEWSATHSSEGQVSIDKAGYIAIDGDGNAIVTGVTNGDGLGDNITTIKYDKSGKSLWVAVYNGSGNYNDRPYGIAIDHLSNIYITGGSTGDNGTATDLITIKYNSGGVQQWDKRYASKGGILDESRSISVDQLGNVYITGFAGHIVTDNSGLDWVTIKYNTNGEQLWLTAYDDGITSDRASKLTIDGLGNVYVTGQCNSPAYTIATIKYDSSGKKQWIAKYDGSAVSDDEPMDIKVDNKGYVYITGHSSESNKDYITIAYDNNGNELWKKNFNGLTNMDDKAEKMIIDDNGNVFVLGYSTVKKNNKNRCLIKYDNSGAEKWNILSDQSVKFSDQGISGLSMAFDKEDNILVTGSSKIVNNSATNMMIDCFRKDGTLLWQTFLQKKTKFLLLLLLQLM